MTKTDKAKEFESWAWRKYNLILYSESDVWIHLFEQSGRVKLSIAIGETTTIDTIRDSWWYVARWRDALEEWQGPDRPWGKEAFHLHLTELKQKGLSYGDMAKRVNQRILDLLREYAEYLKKLAEAQSQFETMQDYYLWIDQQDLYKSMFALEHADDLLKFARPRMKDNERHKFLVDALREVQEGHAPFTPHDGPVMDDDIRARLRKVVKIG